MKLNKVICKLGAIVMFAVPMFANSTIITIDNTDAGFSSVGFVQSLYLGTSRPSIGGSYMVDQPGSQGDYAIWDPSGNADWMAGLWKVEMNWTAWGNRASKALVTIGTGLDTLFINQTINGGAWQDLGNFEFSTSGTFVKIDDSNSKRKKYLVADAVKFTLVSAAQAKAPATQPTLAANSVSAPGGIALLGFAALALFRLRKSK